MIERIERACSNIPLGTAQVLAACASVGIRVNDLETVIPQTYPHHAEEIRRTLTWFRAVKQDITSNSGFLQNRKAFLPFYG
ncbi:MAG TPA: hypothetical protein VHO69_11210 [Phototrophicaceae bacterium]|nr:hypothetical protein [Phototrophicaceae bacterium]